MIRDDVFKEEIGKSYLLAGKMPDGSLSDVIKIWAETLKEIPTESLSRCFVAARRLNKKFSIIQPSQVYEVWRGTSGNSFMPEQNVQQETPMPTVEEITAIAKKYPEFVPLFRSININLDELPIAEWKTEFYRLIQNRGFLN